MDLLEFLPPAISSGDFDTCAKVSTVKNVIQDPPTDLQLADPIHLLRILKQPERKYPNQ